MIIKPTPVINHSFWDENAAAHLIQKNPKRPATK